MELPIPRISIVLTGKNSHGNNNRSPVMMPRRTVTVFLVAIHALLQ